MGKIYPPRVFHCDKCGEDTHCYLQSYADAWAKDGCPACDYRSPLFIFNLEVENGG